VGHPPLIAHVRVSRRSRSRTRACQHTALGALAAGCWVRDGLLERRAQEHAVLGRELSRFGNKLAIGELVFLPRVKEHGDASATHGKRPLPAL
jgi:hypothetical protein